MESEFNKRLKSARKKAGYTQAELAVLGGVSLNSQARYETTDRNPDASYLAKVWKEIDVPFVLTGEPSINAKNTVIIPDIVNDDSHPPYGTDFDEFSIIKLYGVRASAGDGVAVLQEKEKFLYFRNDWFSARGLNAKELIAVTVVGDSMEPDIPDDSVVLVDTTQKEIKDGAVYVFTHNDDLLIKKMMATATGHKAKSINTLYEPIEFNRDDVNRLNVAGRAVRALPDIKL